MTQELVHEYDPRELFLPFHQRENRWACLVVHRRAGKTVACVNELITRALYTKKKNARYAYIAPFYRQAKDVAWGYLKDFAQPFLASPPRESELRVTLLNGAWITLYGADNPDALRGLYLDGAVLDEYGDMRPSMWGKIILPTLTDRKGWAVFIGTPKGQNHFYDTYRRSRTDPAWFSLRAAASETGLLPQEELVEIRAQMSDEEYAQEMECDFEAAVLGTYYANTINQLERDGRITPEPLYNPLHPVSVASDLGYTDSTSMWFWQEIDGEVLLVDYEEFEQAKLDVIFLMLQNKPYDYRRFVFPHDARAETLAAQHSTMTQALDWARGTFPDADVQIAPKLARQHGIDSARQLLPKCRFDRAKCDLGLLALRSYRRKYDEALKVFSKEPVHDWASNGADAFRYLAVVAQRDGLSVPQPVSKPLPLLKEPEYKLKFLFDERESLTGSQRFNRLRLG